MPGEKYVMLSIIAMLFAGGSPRFPMFPEVPWADGVLQHRIGSLLVISKPQKTEYEPSATNVSLVDPAPSMIARSPGYCRTTIGAAAVPVRVLRNWPA